VVSGVGLIPLCAFSGLYEAVPLKLSGSKGTKICGGHPRCSRNGRYIMACWNIRAVAAWDACQRDPVHAVAWPCPLHGSGLQE
jgi:hypothetical protein